MTSESLVPCRSLTIRLPGLQSRVVFSLALVVFSYACARHVGPPPGPIVDRPDDTPSAEAQQLDITRFQQIQRLLDTGKDMVSPEVKRRATKALTATLEQFYASHPVLRGRESCVARVWASSSPATWDALANAATTACVPSNNWVRVDSTGEEGKSIYVDSARIEVRERNQITFWLLAEVFDDSKDFVLGREAVDCDRKFLAELDTADMVAGRYTGAKSAATMQWQSPLPGSIGEEIVSFVCDYRAAQTKPKPRQAGSVVTLVENGKRRHPPAV